jgi:hypothetical protein
MAVIVLLGVYPRLLLDIINPAVISTNSVVRTHDPAPSVPQNSPTNAIPDIGRFSYRPLGQTVGVNR